MNAEAQITAGMRVMVADVDGNEHGAIALSGPESEGQAPPVVWVRFVGVTGSRVPVLAEAVRHVQVDLANGVDLLSEEDVAALLDDRPLTVGRLREVLADLPDDLLVVLQRDVEGNGYLPAGGAEWDPEDAYYPRERLVLTAEDREDRAQEMRAGGTDEVELGPAVSALVLWPTECSADVVLAMPRPAVPAPPVLGR